MVQVIECDNAELELGYWAIRGLGQPIRVMLAHVGQPYREIRLGADANGNLLDKDDEGEDWASHKLGLDVPFPNLPYLFDHSVTPTLCLTQSNTILRYLATKFDLLGDNDHERLAIDQLQEEAYDFRNHIVRTAYTLGQPYKAAYAEFCETALPRYLNGFERFLAKRPECKCFVGTRLSLVDFVIFELVWQMTFMVPGSLTESTHPSLLAFLASFTSRPEIVSYQQSPSYIERPINSPWASFA